MSLKQLCHKPIAIFLILAMGACATVTEEERTTVVQIPTPITSPSETATKQDGPAQLVMFRKWNGEGLVYLGTGPMILLDGQEIGRCKLGKGHEMQIPAGEHVIKARTSQISERRFRVEPGQTAYVECKYTAGALSPNVEFHFKDGR